MIAKLNKRELATVLAALRYFQRDLDQDDKSFGQLYDEGKKLGKPVTAEEIDTLCEKVNQ